jgi:hypothetical protein
MQKVHFIAGLANGETITEGKGNFAIIEGELSPWNKLLFYLAEQQTKITSLSLATSDGKRWNMTSAGKNPKFKAFADAPKPAEYRMFRKMGGDVMSTGEVTEQEHFTVAEAIYENGIILQLWVSEDGQTAWSLII